MMYNIFSHTFTRRIAFFGLVLLIIAGGMGLSANEAKAALGVSSLLSYQGRLTDQNGIALGGGSPGTDYYFCFSIYTDAAVGAPDTKLWPTGTPTSTTIKVIDGVFSANIGSADSLANYDFSQNDTIYLNIEVSSTTGTCGGAPFETLGPRQQITATAFAREAENLYGGEVRVGTSTAVAAGNQKLLKLGLANSAETVGGLCSTAGYPDGAMWYNSNVANARTLVCNNGVIQAVGSAITNQYFAVSGPTGTTSADIKTFTFPNASATVLTDNAAVTAAQGGTGQSSYTIGDLLYASGATALSKLADVAAGSYLRSGGVTTAPVWSTVTLPNTVTTGDLLYASATNVLSVLAKGTANQVLSMNGAGTNVTWATPSGGGSPGGANTQIQFNNASSFGGSADFTWDDTNKTFTLGGVDTEMQLKAITTEPTPPAAGSNNIYIYAKSIAGRIMPKWVGPSGVDVPFQAFVGQDKIAWWNPPGNAATVPGVLGFTAPTALGTATARNVATTSLFTRTRRLGYVSAATNPSYAGHYNVAAGTQYTVGNGTGLGGFFYVVRFGTSDAATVSTAKMFVGMTSTIAAPGTTNPSTFTNSIGVGHSDADANLMLFYGGSAAQAPINLGANFPKNTLSVDMYELILFATPTYTGNPTVGYKVTRLNTNNVAEGTLTGVAGTVLPASTTLLGHRAYRLNNTTLAVGLDIASVYISSDY